MPLEFPAVSQSRIEFWQKPQYTQRGMLLFTIFFGIFGLHHFYLRSPQTGLMFLLANIFTLGYCWFYDIIQLSTLTYDELNNNGLDLPWSYAGIAKGMWIRPKEDDSIIPKGPIQDSFNQFAKRFVKSDTTALDIQQQEQPQQVGGSSNVEEETKEEVSPYPPNPLWFMLYSLLLPLAPLAKLFAGDGNYAMLNFAQLTVIPLGFLFLAVSVLYEYYNLFVYPSDVAFNGIRRIFPFTRLPYFTFDEKGQSIRLTGKVEEEKKEGSSFLQSAFKMASTTLQTTPMGMAASKIFETAKGAIEKSQEIQQKVLETSKFSQLPFKPQLDSTLPIGGVKTPLPFVPAVATGFKQQGGGAKDESFSLQDKVITGGIVAVVLGGFLLHTGRSFWNAVQDTWSLSDLPPASR